MKEDRTSEARPNASRPKRGIVHLVGAGPGDPGLLTVRAARLLRRADVVVYDALVSDAVLELVSPGARLIDVGKRCGGRRTSQSEINQILIDVAAEGGTIVRLKGGDPFVFGRGGEEGLALAEAGVRFRVVPGITAGVGVSAYAGIPVTHRGVSAAVTFVTGHEDVGPVQSRIDWEALAAVPGTLVVYMGVGTLPTVAERLIRAGKSPDTPAAVVQWGTIGRQRTVEGPLGRIADVASVEGISSPALVVIGEVVRLREQLAWFDRLPLRGRRIVVARSRAQRSRIAAALSSLGAEVSEYPRVVARPVDLREEDRERLSRAGECSWVLFTSAAGVRHFFRQLAAQSGDARSLAGARVAALGAETARALRQQGITPDFAARTFEVAEVTRALGAVTPLQGAGILFPRDAAIDSPIVEALRSSGARVDELVLFDTTSGAPARDAGPELATADLLILPSSTAARTVARALESRPAPRGRIVAIGPRTAQSALDCGLIVHAVAADHTVRGVVAAVRALLDRDQAGAPAVADSLVDLLQG